MATPASSVSISGLRDHSFPFVPTRRACQAHRGTADTAILPFRRLQVKRILGKMAGWPGVLRGHQTVPKLPYEQMSDRSSGSLQEEVCASSGGSPSGVRVK